MNIKSKEVFARETLRSVELILRDWEDNNLPEIAIPSRPDIQIASTLHTLHNVAKVYDTYTAMGVSDDVTADDVYSDLVSQLIDTQDCYSRGSLTIKESIMHQMELVHAALRDITALEERTYE